MTVTSLRRVAGLALIALVASSLALPLGPPVVRFLAGGSTLDGSIPSGLVLAAVKVLALAVLFRRLRAHDTYALQWSSMFVLLFVAEGIVRAMTDPQPVAAIGGVEMAAALVYFAAVLAILRPLKQQAKRSVSKT